MPQKAILYTLFLAILISLPALCNGQADVWNNGKQLQAKAGKAKKKVKDYKEHLQHWALDSNYRKEVLIGGKLNSNGWSGNIWFLKKKSAVASNVWVLGFSEIRHEKEIKQQGTNGTFPQLGNASPYIFGKLNDLYAVQLGFGRERFLLPSVLENNLSVSIRYGGGLSLAMLKPYYLKLINVDYSGAVPTATLNEEKYNHQDSASFLNSSFILGASNWSKGLREIIYVPGAYAEAAISIQPGENKSFIQVIILGINGAVYARSLPIMVDQKAYPWQVSLFAGLGIGKRW